MLRAGPNGSEGNAGAGAGAGGSAFAMPPVNNAADEPAKMAVVVNTFLIRDMGLPIARFGGVNPKLVCY
jgi:hypothetical protein